MPSVQYYADAVMTRDAGTLLTELTWNLKDLRNFFPAAMMTHIHGPGEFLVTNLFNFSIGQFFPLTPTVSAIPNIIFAFLGVYFAFRLGKLLYSENFGYLCGSIFGLMPWIPWTIRYPGVYNLFSSFLELSVLYAYSRYMLEPKNKFYRIAAPVALAAYLTTALDWPSFLFMLFVYLFLNKKLSEAIKNRFNIFPLLVFLAFAGSLAILVYYEKTYGPYNIYFKSLLLRPFFKIVDGGGEFPPLLVMLRFLANAFGPALILAVLGIGTYFKRRHADFPLENGFNTTQKRNFFVSMILGISLFVIPLSKNSSHPYYGYVMCIPVTFLSALFLYKLQLRRKGVLIACLAFLLIIPGWNFMYKVKVFAFQDDDLSPLAVASFLVEEHPDLLREGKMAFLPRNIAANVGQHARGANGRIIMPVYFPDRLVTSSVSSKQDVLLDFVVSYNTKNEIKADWLVLTSDESLNPDHGQQTPKSYGFYKKLFVDPRINWIACFKDDRDRKLWIGEVKSDGEGSPAEQAKIYDVGPWAKTYMDKYYRIDFLKKNAIYVDHY